MAENELIFNPIPLQQKFKKKEEDKIEIEFLDGRFEKSLKPTKKEQKKKEKIEKAYRRRFVKAERLKNEIKSIKIYMLSGGLH